MLHIRIAGREILGGLREPQRVRGLIVKPKGFQGWQGLSKVRRDALARAVEHGEHDTPVYLGSRVVTVDGWVFGDSAEEVGHLSDSLTGLFAAGRTRVQITHQGKTLWADGRVVVAECDDSGADELVSEFELQVVFADPRRYGKTNVFPEVGVASAALVSHYGNFPAFPVVEIPAAPAAYTVSSEGRVFSVTGATAGGTHRIDLRRGRVYRNGVEMPGVGRGDLWTVLPGPATTFLMSAPGRVKVTDTYV